MKKIICLLVALIIIIPAVTFSASAANNAIISFSKNDISIGDEVTVTVTVNPEKSFAAVKYTLSYDANIFSFKSTDSSSEGGAGVIKLVESFAPKTKVSYKFVFTANAVGTPNFEVSDCEYSDENGDYRFGGASARMTVKDKTLSDNANLKSLTISGVDLSPKFSATTTNYTATVFKETTKVNVTARTADSDAKVKSVTGNTNLKIGANTVTITVEAANGTQKVYTIVITRSEESGQQTEQIPQDNSLNVIVSGANFSVVPQITEEVLFKGFEIDTITFKEKQIEVAVDPLKNYVIYYLKAEGSEELVPYTYDEKLGEFEILKYIVFNNNVYIFENLPTDKAFPENLYESNLQIGKFTVEGLSDIDAALSDFSFVNCYANGTTSFYRYDSLEGTLQRFPLSLVAKTDENNEKIDYIERFNSLSTNGKVIIIAFLVAILGVVTLIILLIIFIIKRFRRTNDEIDFEAFEEDEDFEVVTVESQDSSNE